MTSAPARMMMMASTSRGLFRCGGADGILSTTTRRILQSTRATPLPVGVAAFRQFSASARNAGSGGGFLRGKPGGFHSDPFHKTLLTQRQQVVVIVAAFFTFCFFNDYFMPDKPKPGTLQHYITLKPATCTTKWYPDKQEEEMD